MEDWMWALLGLGFAGYCLKWVFTLTGAANRFQARTAARQRLLQMWQERMAKLHRYARPNWQERPEPERAYLARLYWEWVARARLERVIGTPAHQSAARPPGSQAGDG